MEEQKPEQASENNKENTLMGVIAYVVFFVPLLTDAKDDPFVKYHVKQGLLLFLIAVGAVVLTPILFMIVWLIHLAVLVLAIMGIVNVLNHKKEPVPFIGQFAEKFKF
ncbi:MAG: hypothetical protein ABIH87_04740 [bacterium]